MNAWTVFLASYLLAVAFIVLSGCRRNAQLRRQIHQTHYCRTCARLLLHLEKADGLCLVCQDEASGLPPVPGNCKFSIENSQFPIEPPAGGRLVNLHFRDPALEGADFGSALPSQKHHRATTSPAPGR